ncbi:hypothetical protein [Rhizobium sp. Leaf384]|uniref:hypothetical protein n=1 Tax=Rhizobium sp. Leaf384 TaxID=1736358 RepID=UPI000ACF0F33|nr:hypothetical protein [Rhizobium sp. Leaf384]
MASDDIKQLAWAIVAEHMTRGEKDPAKMVEDGIRRERHRWTGDHNESTLHESDGGLLINHPSLQRRQRH